jgi:hypothetical protein
MALPIFRAAGTVAAGTTGAVTPGLPAGLVAGDVCILVGTTLVAGTLSITTVGSIGTWNAITGSPQDVAVGEKLYVWWGIYRDGSTAPQLTPGGDHAIARIAAYYKVHTPAPIHTQAAGSETTSDTSFSFATGLTTTVNNCMILCAVTSGVDSGTAQFSGAFSNANLAGITTRLNNNTANGGGGGFALVEGSLASAGAVGTWAETLAGNSPKAYLSFALEPTRFNAINKYDSRITNSISKWNGATVATISKFNSVAK